VKTAACTTCGLEKPHAEFYHGHLNASGAHGRCRDCHRAYMAAWRAQNQDKVKGYRTAMHERKRARRAAAAA
jgi:hypothetical protein